VEPKLNEFVEKKAQGAGEWENVFMRRGKHWVEVETTA